MWLRAKRYDAGLLYRLRSNWSSLNVTIHIPRTNRIEPSRCTIITCILARINIKADTYHLTYLNIELLNLVSSKHFKVHLAWVAISHSLKDV